MSRSVRAHPTAARRVLLALILVVAFVLRVWNLDWDQGTHQHPDERYWSIVTDDIAWPGFTGYLDSAGSSLNPYTDRDTWVYGTLPLFATKATAAFLHDGPFPAGAIVTVLDTVGVDLRNTVVGPDGAATRVDAFDAGYGVNLVGRLLSALADTGTVLLVYLLGRRLADRRAGLVAAALLATTPLHIQYAHFHGAEAWVTFFVTAAMLGSLRLVSGDLRPRVVLGTGAVMGCAAASKLTASAALVVPMAALAIAAAPSLTIVAADIRRRLGTRTRPVDSPTARDPGPGDTFEAVQAARRTLAHTVAAGATVLAATAAVFRLLQPYAFDGLVSLDPRFTRDLDYLEGVNSGGNVPWVVQWIDRTPVAYPLWSALRTGFGPALGLLVVAGVIVAARDVLVRRRWLLLPPLALLAVMIGLVSQQFNPLIRYLLPAYPVAVTLAGIAAVRAWDAGRRRHQGPASRGLARGRAARVAAASLVGASVLWGVAFTNGVYGQTHPRIEASIWMARNLPGGATISSQIWDDALPLGVPGTEGYQPETVVLDPFLPDRATTASGTSKTDQLLADLDRIDYVVEASNRLYDAIPRVSAKYPGTSRYYRALFDGSLGFERIASFTNEPSLFGIDFPDAGVEETFTVYDHPTVTIWAKTERYRADVARAIVDPEQAALGVDLVPSEARSNALLLPTDRMADRWRGETFDEAFGGSGTTSGHWAGLWWFVWIQAISFAVLPWVVRLFPMLPSRGYGLSKAVGFLAVGGLCWVTTAWGVADSGRALAWFWTAIMVAAGAVSGWHRRHALAAVARRRWPSWLAAEAVFCAAFGLVLWMRSANPDLWEAYLGGEKPMELAYLTSIARSSSLPPADPWFAGGAMNYYYLGWFLLTVPMRALRILPEVAFNLGVATYAALTAVTAFTVVHDLVGVSSRRARRRRGRVRREARPPARGPIGAGLVGVVLLMGIGNLDAVRIQIERLRAVNGWGGDGLPVIGPLIGIVGGSWAWATGTPLARFDWWAPSRVNHHGFDITEFPYFTFLFGDLHPHLMGLVVVGITVALALAHVLAARDGDSARATVIATGLGLSTAGARMINTWDLPTTAVIAVGAVVMGQLVAPRHRHGGDADRSAAALCAVAGLAIGLSTLGGPGSGFVTVSGVVGIVGLGALVAPGPVRGRLLRMLRHGVTIVVAHMVVAWPFIADSETFDTGIGEAAATTPIRPYLLHWGIFVGIAAVLVAALTLDETRRRAEGDDPVPLIWSPVSLERAWTTIAGVMFALAVAGAAVSVTVAFAIGLAGALAMLALAARELRRRRPDPAMLVVLGLFAVAFAVSSGVDVVTVDNDIERMNTVFKFWLQAWQLFALAAAYAIWRVGVIVGTTIGAPSRARHVDAGHEVVVYRRAPRRAWAVVVGVALLAGLVYPVLATRARLETRFATLAPTLDGLAYLDTSPVIFRIDDPATGEVTVSLADDLPLIEWLRANVEGTPSIIEWAGPAYDWNARIATHTGLPTVLGWEWHQRQQRWGLQSMVDDRLSAVRRFYTDADDAEIARILRAYEVSYVIVGTQEHRFADPAALARLAAHRDLEPVFTRGGAVIYRVRDLDPAAPPVEPPS